MTANTLLEFSSLFNSEHGSDLVIHTSSDPSAAKIYCHKFLLKCASEKLYENLMKNKFEFSGGSDLDKDHVLIIDELRNKEASWSILFINIIYDGSVIAKHTDAAQLDLLKEIFINGINSKSKPSISPFASGIEKFKPKLNSNTDLGDFTIYFDNEKKNFLKAHQLMLEKASQYYFGLFSSGMKESSSREATITIDADASSEDVGKLTEELFSIVYSKTALTRETLENMTPDSLFGVAAVAAKYFFADIKKLIDVYLESTREYPEYIIPATKYQNEEALAFATRTLFDQILNINLTMMPVEILKTVRYGDGETIFHAIVKTYRDGGVPAIDQVRTLERMFGDNSETTLETKDEHGNNALHFACRNGPRRFKDIIDLMLERKTDMNAKNDQGEIPLKLALQSFYVKEYFDDFFQLDELMQRQKENPHLQPSTIIDRMMAAGSKLDMNDDETLGLLIDHACRYKDHFHEESWKRILDELDKVSLERIQKCLKPHSLKICLANAFRRPITYLFGKRKLPYEVEDDIKTNQKKHPKEVSVKFIDMDTVQIDKKDYAVSKMQITRQMGILKMYNNFNVFNGFDVSVGKDTIRFCERTDDSYRLISALVYIRGGIQKFTTNTKVITKERY